jgi:hypothetical protein
MDGLRPRCATKTAVIGPLMVFIDVTEERELAQAREDPAQTCIPAARDGCHHQPEVAGRNVAR